ncbi:MAG TPA: CHAP domain-containing protein [Gaiellaceae bacterium]|nr:CHAP domain-containing protein [Gaiellaceae bacterium]
MPRAPVDPPDAPRVLHVTTPFMTGPDVTAAQQALATNQYGTFFTGEVDGSYGPLTAQATYRAKYWLGYPLKQCDQMYGPVLAAYLVGTKELPAANLVRREQRQTPHEPLRALALAKAKTQLGVKESPPTSNRVAFSEWYGVIGPWCAMFASWCYVESGSKTFAQGKDYSYVPYIVGDARAGKNNLTVTTDPQPGDLVCYDWDHDGVADHVGLFNAWISLPAGTFEAVEGNTSVGNDSDGGEVMLRTDRNRSEVIAFVHVGA